MFFPFHEYRKWSNRCLGCLLDLRGQEGVFNRWEALILITVTSSTKLKCFQQKYQEFKNNGISTPTSLISLWCLKIRMAVSNVNIISESLLKVIVAIVSLSSPWTWHWRRYNTQTIVTQTRKLKNWMILLSRESMWLHHFCADWGNLFLPLGF